jgi:vacuolar-type H+-ATPase subunit I/STV1
MKQISWQALLGIALIVLSAFVYFIHYLIFHDVHHIFLYLIGDVAFVFIEVLLVTIIIHRLLGEREKRAKLEKMNMVIGTFFSEVGTELLGRFSRFDSRNNELQKQLIGLKEFSQNNFLSVMGSGLEI